MPYKNIEDARKNKREYFLKNREKINKYRREYIKRPEVKARTNKYLKLYRIKNHGKLLQYQRKWHKKHPLTKEQKILYMLHAREKRKRPEVKIRISKYKKEYLSTHRNQIKQYRKTRKMTDKRYAIEMRLRRCVCQALTKYTQTGKIMTSKKYGIDYKAIIEHLKPFPKDLSKYHIDHIKPLCSFNIEDSEEIKLAFAPENHQWLLAKDNLKKGSKF